MSARQPGPYDSIARKWLALAERGKAHVIELRDSGRWEHYYTPAQLLEALEETARTHEAWAELVNLFLREAEAS